jgi:hypothetical protein
MLRAHGIRLDSLEDSSRMDLGTVLELGSCCCRRSGGGGAVRRRAGVELCLRLSTCDVSTRRSRRSC